MVRQKRINCLEEAISGNKSALVPQIEKRLQCSERHPW